MNYSTIIQILIIFILTYRIYKNWKIFKKLTIKEWITYIAGLLVTIGIAFGIIFTTFPILEEYVTGFMQSIIKIAMAIAVLILASQLFSKFIPKKLYPFYKLDENEKTR